VTIGIASGENVTVKHRWECAGMQRERGFGGGVASKVAAKGAAETAAMAAALAVVTYKQWLRIPRLSFSRLSLPSGPSGSSANIPVFPSWLSSSNLLLKSATRKIRAVSPRKARWSETRATTDVLRQKLSYPSPPQTRKRNYDKGDHRVIPCRAVRAELPPENRIPLPNHDQHDYQ